MKLFHRKIERETITSGVKRNRLVLGILLVWIVFCAPFFFRGQMPMPTKYLVSFFAPWNAYFGMPVKNNAMPDIITQIYPWRMLDVAALKRGMPALWNPYSFSGTAHAANYQSAAFFPLNILFAALPEWITWSILVLFQPLLAGIFMFLFVRFGLKRTPGASLISGFSFMFCGFLTVWMGYATLGYAVLVLPFLLLLIMKWYESPSWWYGIVVSFGLAFSFYSGHFQMSMYVAGITFVYATYLFFVSRSLHAYGTILCFWTAGILLAVPQLVISFDAIRVSSRTESFITAAGIPWHYLVTLVSPDFFGNPVTRNDWFGQYAEWASYIGAIPLFFALLGMMQTQKHRLWFFVLVLVGSLLLATISPISWLLYALKIPVISTSVATRMIVFFSFSLCVFAAYGWDSLMEAWESSNKRQLIIAGLIIGCVLLLSWGGTLLLRNTSPEHFRIAVRNLVLPSLFLISTVVLCFVALLYRSTRRFVPFILLFLVAFDMYRYAAKWMPFDPPEHLYPKSFLITFLQEHAPLERVFGNVGNELNTTYAIQSIEGYDALYQARYGEFISAAGDGLIKPLERSVVLIDRQGKYTKRWFDLLGVRYILYRISDGRNVWAFPHWNYDGMMPVFMDAQYEVLENQQAFPRAFLASSYKMATGKQEIIDMLTSPDTDIRKTIILENKPLFDPQEGNSKSQVMLYHPDRVMVRVDTETPKLLFLSDVYDVGWRALINGKSAPILRADYAFRAVSVPAGISTVEFYYAPERLRRATIVALLVVFVFLAGSVRKLYLSFRFRF